jgi:hypothetical protein
VARDGGEREPEVPRRAERLARHRRDEQILQEPLRDVVRRAEPLPFQLLPTQALTSGNA